MPASAMRGTVFPGLCETALVGRNAKPVSVHIEAPWLHVKPRQIRRRLSVRRMDPEQGRASVAVPAILRQS